MYTHSYIYSHIITNISLFNYFIVKEYTKTLFNLYFPIEIMVYIIKIYTEIIDEIYLCDICDIKGCLKKRILDHDNNRFCEACSDVYWCINYGEVLCERCHDLYCYECHMENCSFCNVLKGICKIKCGILISIYTKRCCRNLIKRL